MTKYIDGVRAALEEMAQKKEGNAFTKALMAARKAGDATFTVAGKEYKCEDYDDEGNVKEAVKYPHMMYDPKTGKEVTAKTPEDHEKFAKMGYTHEKPKMDEAMDPVNPKAVKKDFKDRKDKDIDNDGDVDDSDEYLHKKRKAISKSKGKNEDEPEGEKGETAKMNPKKEDKVTKESTVRERLMSIWEDAAGAKRKAGATDPEPMSRDDERSGKKMRDGHSAEKKGEIGKEADDSSAAEKSTKASPMRGNDNKMGDRQIINKIANAYKTLGKGKDV